MPQRKADRRRIVQSDLATANIHEFQRAPAHIADQPIGVHEAGQDAVRRQLGLALVAEDFDPCAADAFGLRDELVSVPGNTHRRGCERVEAFHTHMAHESAKAAQGSERAVDILVLHPARLGDIAAKTADDAFIVELGRRAGESFKDHQPNRVRPDVDHRNRLAPVNPGTLVLIHAVRSAIASPAPSSPALVFRYAPSHCRWQSPRQGGSSFATTRRAPTGSGCS